METGPYHILNAKSGTWVTLSAASMVTLPYPDNASTWWIQKVAKPSIHTIFNPEYNVYANSSPERYVVSQASVPARWILEPVGENKNQFLIKHVGCDSHWSLQWRGPLLVITLETGTPDPAGYWELRPRVKAVSTRSTDDPTTIGTPELPPAQPSSYTQSEPSLLDPKATTSTKDELHVEGVARSDKAASGSGSVRDDIVYRIYNKKYTTGVKVPLDADDEGLIGFRSTKEAEKGYKWKILQYKPNIMQYEPDKMQCRIYNVDFKRFAKRGHFDEDYVEMGHCDSNDNSNNDYHWWIIKPVVGKENCFT
ncbi:hypothetical protein FRC06_011049 [Ceratobasidium sp. 370]|nr:hypothetical protein FRC06_011049 [Ceratobasidium sp. 370]